MNAARASLGLRHSGGTTPIWIGDGVLAAAVAAAGELFAGRRLFVLSSPTILGLHAPALAALAAPAAPLDTIEVPDGEAAKRLTVVEAVWERLATGGGRRDSVVVAFGGGSVGDLAGFVAATFLRGVRFAQIPTTLLAQVDAAIGGKTGIDLAAGKNLVGAFHPPAAVISDSRFLATLPRAELRSGLVEAVKMAALLDLDLLARIERDLAALLAGDAEALAPVVRAAAAAKVGVVERDPYEAGERQLLNFGHTLGHALEAEAGYGSLAHGDAVAWGIRFANRLARHRGADNAFLDRIDRLIDRLEPAPLPAGLDPAGLVARMGRDKKARRDGLTWILAAGPGRGIRDPELPPELVRREIEAFLRAL